MLRHRSRKPRRGAATVEFAIAAPVVFFLVFATMIGSLGMFRFQQVASLAREGARWASVHGAQYAEETGNPAATPEDVFRNAVLPSSVLLDRDRLTCVVSWDKSNIPLEVVDDVHTPVANTVSVTVGYQWFPEMFSIGPVTLTSTSTAQMIY